LQIEPAVDHPVAVWTDPLKCAGKVSGLHTLGDLSGGHLRGTARKAEDAAWPTRAFRLYSPGDEEAAKFLASNQNRSTIIDGL
jgi:hypothetical protein